MLVERLKLDPTIFRAYDIRGIVGKEISEENIFLLGRAIASYVREQGGKQIVIARDGRESGLALNLALSAGLRRSGCDVIDIGIVPTPVLYFATHQFGHCAGVMLTASHNPAEYNGLKMVINGAAFTEQEIKNLYERIVDNQFLTGEGELSFLDIVAKYEEVIVNDIKLSRSLKVVLDAGNGVTGLIAPALFTKLGCEVIPLFCEVDGRFPNHHPDPSNEHNLQDLIAAVKQHKADIGLAFDGDGDRLGIVTSAGSIICADRVLMLFAKALLAKHPNETIIFDVKCTNQLSAVIKEEGGKPLMWKTGHSLIKSKMAQIKAKLAGEMSGHFFFKDRWFGFDDGMYAGARLLEILSEQTKSSEAIFAAIPNGINTPELKVPVSEKEKFSIMETLVAHASFPTAEEVNTIDGLRVNFAEGWGLLRPSNTSPYLVLRFEAQSSTILTEIQTLFKNWMLSARPDLVLPF